MELRTLANVALNPDAAAVSFNEMLGNGESQPSAAHFTGARHIDPVEAFEDSRLISLRDADTCVRNREGYFGTVS